MWKQDQVHKRRNQETKATIGRGRSRDYNQWRHRHVTTCDVTAAAIHHASVTSKIETLRRKLRIGKASQGIELNRIDSLQR